MAFPTNAVKNQGLSPTSINPAVSSKPHIRFMFCTACPAAPFTRLSITDNTTTVSPP